MVNSQPISLAAFDALAASSMTAAGPASGAQSVSHFEMMTAMALQHFKDSKVRKPLFLASYCAGGSKTRKELLEGSC